MRNPTPVTTRGLSAFLAALTSLLVSTAGFAATSDVASTANVSAQPTGELLELDEIWVRGKQLSDVIADAESDFFRRYNKLNKKNQFDVQCGYARLSRDSLAMSRTCLPQFLSALASSPGSFSMSAGSCASGPGFLYSASTSPYVGCEGMPATWMINQSRNQTTAMYARSSGQRQQALQQEYLRNFSRILYSDSELMEKADELDALYAEMNAIQDSYVQVKTGHEAGKGSSVRENSGPRAGPRL